MGRGRFAHGLTRMKAEERRKKKEPKSLPRAVREGKGGSNGFLS
jgi:hypothetical protein